MAHQPQFFHSPIFFPCEIDLGKKQVLFVVQVSVLIRDKMFSFTFNRLQFIYQKHYNCDDHFKYFFSVENVVACSRQLVNKTKRDSKLRNSTLVPAEEKMRKFVLRCIA